METILIKNILPTRFQNWCELYHYIKDRILIDTIHVNYAENGINTVWEFRLDFIKARCFEEVVEFFPETCTSDYGEPGWEVEELNKYQEFGEKFKLEKIVRN